MTRWWWAIAALGVGCHAATPDHVAAVDRAPLAAAGPVIAALEQAGALYLFAPDRATIERGGVTVATIPAPDGRWADATTMPALDDTGTWVVARTTKGSLWRLTATGDLEPVHDLLGLPPTIRAIAGGPTTIGLALDDGIAILRDRAHLSRFPAQALPRFAAGDPPSVLASRDRIAIRHAGQLDVWDLADLSHASYAVPGAIAAGFTDATGHGTLVVATGDALFIEAPGAGLRRMAAPAPLRGLAIAGSRLWIATSGGVFVVDHGRFVRARVEAAAADHLFGLGDGDLVLATAASLTRLTLARPADDPRWSAEVAPIAHRVCLKCHGPGGDAGVDLSTAAAWRTERTALVHRVVETRTMPPAGTPLSAADRKTLADWLAH